MNTSVRFEHLHTLRRMWRHPAVERPELADFQLRKLKHLVAYAYTHVAHYRELFDQAGIKPADIRSLPDLRRLPLTSKDDLRSRPLGETLVSGASPGRLVARLTSGSSGMPFTVRRSRFEEHLMNLFRDRARHLVGMKFSDRIAVVSEPRIGGNALGVAGRLRQAAGVHRSYPIDCYLPVDEINRRLDRLQPDIIRGYPSSLSHVVESRRPDAAKSARPRLVFTGGEVLSKATRKVLERGFDAPLYDFYGAHEFNLGAWECPQGGAYHVCDDNIILEVLDGENPSAGETGEVVITALHAYTMPFIRYRTGDIATRGPEACACGQPFSTLLGVRGRAVEMFRLPGNRVVHPYEIAAPLIDHHHSWVLQHQMIHRSEASVELRIRAKRPPSEAERAKLMEVGNRVLGPDVAFAIILVDDFAVRPGEKFSPYISLHQ